MRERDHGIDVQPRSRRMRASAEIVIERPLDGGLGVGVGSAPLASVGGAARDVSVEELEGRRITSTHDYDAAAEGRVRGGRAARSALQVVRAMSGGYPFEGTLELSEDVGGTRVRQTVDAGPEDALARFVFAVARPFVRRSMRRRIAAQLARLKAMVELEAAL